MAFKTEGLSDVEKQYGKLTIFASYFSGTGKSWRMLKRPNASGRRDRM